MKNILFLGIAATVLNALVVWVLTHFLIVVLGAASWGIWRFIKVRRNDYVGVAEPSSLDYFDGLGVAPRTSTWRSSCILELQSIEDSALTRQRHFIPRKSLECHKQPLEDRLRQLGFPLRKILKILVVREHFYNWLFES